MSEGQYYIFGTNVYGGGLFYEATDDQQRVLKIVKDNHDHETVYGLRVVYGTLLEFEPATVVKTYRIKDESCCTEMEKK